MTPPAPGPRGAQLEPGTLVGEYQISHKLGEGGMGIVYAGVHPEIGKRVAIKVLAPSAASHPDLIRRFKEEARAVNKIRHPNIIDIFAFNQLPDGRHYFVMEYLEGESLSARLARTPMVLGEARRLLAQICDALEAAHRAGVIHRDLKPDNIWIAVEGTTEPRVKLLDFGIAKLNDLAPGKATQAGTQLGTPHYMPPEQAMGREIDARTDIYALGVILYEMFAGKLPFDGLTTHEIVLKHVTEPPALPSRHRPIVPPGMEAIILACLEKSPDRRPKSARELGARIDGVFAAAPAGRDAPQTIEPATARPAIPRTAVLLEPDQPPQRELARTAALSPDPIVPVPGQTSPMPVQSSPGPSTTLRASTGQLEVAGTPEADSGVPDRRPARRAWPGPLAAAAVLVAGGLYLGFARHRAVTVPPGAPAAATVAPAPAAAEPPPVPAVAAPAPAPPPVTVTIKIDSRPSGARVIDASDGSVMGRTPLSASRPRADGALGLTVELDGYKPHPISVPLGADFSQTIELESRAHTTSRSRRVAAPTPPAAAAPPTSPPHPSPSPSPRKAPQIEWE